MLLSVCAKILSLHYINIKVMEKTLYVSDLDGTLLNSNSEVTEPSRILLNRLICEDGILFTVATARTPATVVRLMSGIETSLPYIVMTGAAMWKGGLVNRCYMKPGRVEYLLDVCRRNGITPFLYIYDDRESMLEVWHAVAMNSYERNFMRQRTGTPYKRFVISDSLPEDVVDRTMLLFAAAPYGKVSAAYSEAQKRLPCSMTCYHDIFDPSTGFFEVMAEGVSKAAAVKKLADDVGATRIVVFGDSPNDLSMRSVADLFVAPENASKEVLAVADCVADNNNNDCVVRWIEADVAHRHARQ